MSFPEVALGQVDTVHASEYAVSVVFPNLGMLSGIRVPVAAANASRNTGEFALPKRGDWGIVMFYQNDARSARWMGTLTDAFWSAAPLELLTADPDLRTDFERNGRDSYWHGNGDIEVQYADGSLFRLTHSSDAKDKRTQRKVGVTTGDARTPQRQDPERKNAPPLQLYFEQKDGARVSLDPEGTFDLTLDGAYEMQGKKDGMVRIANQKASLIMQPSGDSALTLSNGATLHISSAGDITAKPAPGMPIKLGPGPSYRPVMRMGDLGNMGFPLIATSTTVLASD